MHTVLLREFGVKIRFSHDLLTAVMACEGVREWYLNNRGHALISSIEE